jgi:hypothetical protein
MNIPVDCYNKNKIMKNLFILFLSSCLFIACNNDHATNNRDKDNGYNNRDEKNNKDDEYDNSDNKKNNNTRWSTAEEDKFFNDCQKGAPGNMDAHTVNQFCSCVLEKNEEIYATYNDAMKEGNETKLASLSGECRNELNIPNNGDANRNTRWTTADENKYLSECGKLNKAIFGDDANEYCPCMLQKYEKLFTSYDEYQDKVTNDQMHAVVDQCSGKQQ